jgi:hypothetical protein
MDPITIIAGATAAIKLAQTLIAAGQQLFGTEKIPSFEEILALNAQGQDAIDAEMKKRGLVEVGSGPT